MLGKTGLPERSDDLRPDLIVGGEDGGAEGDLHLGGVGTVQVAVSFCSVFAATPFSVPRQPQCAAPTAPVTGVVKREPARQSAVLIASTSPGVSDTAASASSSNQLGRPVRTRAP